MPVVIWLRDCPNGSRQTEQDPFFNHYDQWCTVPSPELESIPEWFHFWRESESESESNIWKTPGIGIRDFGLGIGIGFQSQPGIEIGIRLSQSAWNRNWNPAFRVSLESESESRHWWNCAWLKHDYGIMSKYVYLPKKYVCILFKRKE